MKDVWHIAGVGAIGGLFAHRLSNGGAHICLLTRDSRESQRVVRLGTAEATIDTAFPCDWVGNTAPIQHLLITTKSWGAADALANVAHRLTPSTVVVAMMNGMQHVDDVNSVANACQRYFASTTAGCHRVDGIWIPAGTGKTLIGTDKTEPEPAWLACWKRGVADLSWCDDMTDRLVEKVAINSCINPLTAIHKVTNGALLSPPFDTEVLSVTEEVSLIVRDLGYEKLAATLPTKVRDVLRDTADNTSSMLNDIVNGRRTESNAILGWLLRQSLRESPKLTQLANQLQLLEPTP